MKEVGPDDLFLGRIVVRRRKSLIKKKRRLREVGLIFSGGEVAERKRREC